MAFGPSFRNLTGLQHLTGFLPCCLIFFTLTICCGSNTAMSKLGLISATLAVLTAFLGLAQPLLFQKCPRSRAYAFDVLNVYYGVHFLAVAILFCIWKIPLPLAHQQLALRLLLECAWIEGLSLPVSTRSHCEIQLLTSAQLRIFFGAARSTLPVQVSLWYLTGITFLLHTLGFVLLVLGYNNGKTLLFGASILLPFSQSAAYVYIVYDGWSYDPKTIAVGIGNFLTVCALVPLTSIENTDNFLQVSDESAG